MRKIGIIGCGKWGQNYVRTLANMPESPLYICCDENLETLEKIQQQYPWVRITTDYQEVLRDQEVEGVVIVTPSDTHYQVARECLLAGKHILVEKPFTVNTLEAENLLKISTRLGRIIMVGHLLLYHPAIAKMKEIIHSGMIGRINYITANRANLGCPRKDVNVMWDLASHDIYSLLYLLEAEPLEVDAWGAAYGGRKLEDIVFVNLRFPGDILVHLQASWIEARKVRELVVVGEKGTVIFDDLQPQEKLRVYLNEQPNQVYAPAVEISQPLQNECQHFLDSIEDNRSPLTNGFEGLRTVRILQKAQVCLEKRKNDPFYLTARRGTKRDE